MKLRSNVLNSRQLNFDNLVLIFCIGSIFGVFYEEILTLINGFYRTGLLLFESRKGLIYGPFNPLYGFALVVVTCLLGRKERKWPIILLYGALLGGGIEYSINFLQEKFVGTVSWNYHNYFLNINGRTTIPFMLFWGLLSLFYIKSLYPFLMKIIDNLQFKLKKILVISLCLFLSFDMFVSFTALFRQNLRKNGMEPYTVIGKLYDKIYTDDYLKKIYPNMIKTNNAIYEVN